MKTFISLLFFLFLFCSKEDNSTYVRRDSSPRQYEGWHGAPETLDKKPFDYYFMTQKGIVKSKKIKPEQMENACMDSVKEKGLDKFIENLVISTFANSSGEMPDNFNALAIKSTTIRFKKQNYKVEILMCNNKSANPEWIECECITYMSLPGGRDYFISELMKM